MGFRLLLVTLLSLVVVVAASEHLVMRMMNHFTREDMIIILNAIRGFNLRLFRSYDDQRQNVRRGAWWSDAVATSVGNVIFTLWIYGPAPVLSLDNPVCHIYPQDLHVSTTVAQTHFRNILQNNWVSLFNSRAAFAFFGTARYAIEYYLENIAYPDSDSEEHTLHTSNSSAPNFAASMAILEDNDCTRIAGLRSGPKGLPRSTLYAGQSISSASLQYQLQMRVDCQLLLVDLWNGRIMWEMKTSVSRVKQYDCRLRLALDGNLMVLNGNDELIWALNKYCTPQPHCLMLALLAVQDDGSLVEYVEDKTRDLQLNIRPIWTSAYG